MNKSEEKHKAHRLSRANYIPRVLGFAASFFMITLLVIHRDWSSWNIFFLGICFLVYPHLVYLSSKYSNNGKRIELSAMMFETFMLGFWTAHIHFVLWISYAFISAIVLNHIMVGGFRQLIKALGLFASGVVLAGAFSGFRIEPAAPLHIEIIAMFSLLLFIMSVAWTFYYVNDRLAMLKMEQEEKNRQLEETLQELDAAKGELVEKAHKAGMADIATGVLHNVGNVLNSVNTSTTLIENAIEHSKLEGLMKANSLLRQNIDTLEDFVTGDPKSKKLMHYYLKLEEPLQNEHGKILQHTRRLAGKIKIINEVIAAQQNYAGAGIYAEETQLSNIVENALSLQAGSIERHGLNVTTQLEACSPVIAQQSKLIHVLVNLFKNAKESMEGNHPENKNLVIKTWQDPDKVCLSVTDNGSGIKKEYLNKIFSHTFTTKKNGHGFGLHSSANYMTEMGAEIHVDSPGKGKGATFTLTFPMANKKETSIIKR